MALTVKNAQIWIRRGDDRAGLAADALGPLGEAGVSLSCVMGYCYPGQPGRAAVEVFPIKGKKAEKAARSAGFAPSDTPCLLVEGDDRPGLGAAISRSVAAAGLSMSFLVGQVIGRKFNCMIGFGSDADAAAATKAIKAAGRKR